MDFAPVYTNLPQDESIEREYEIKWKYVLRQVWIASCCWTIYFCMGLFLGAPTVMIPQIRKDVNSTIIITHEMASWLTSIFSYAAIPWVIILPYLAGAIGRKKTSIIAACSTVLAFIVFFFTKNITQLLLAESIIAITHANIVTISVIVISEYTSPKYRGLFLSIKSASLFWGIWVSNSIGTFFHWKNIALFGFLCSLYTLSMFVWPESPYWLASKGRYTECKKSHYWLKGTESKELKKLLDTKDEICQSTVKVKFFEKSFLMPVFLSMVAICQYHMSGKFVLSMYAVEIMKKIIVDERNVYKCMLILDGVTVFSTYIGCVLSKVLKRRTLLIYSSSVAILFLFSMSLYLYLIKLSFLEENLYLSVFFLAGFSLSISVGPMILATSLYGELIPLKYKSVTIVIIGLIFLFLHGTLLKLAPVLFSNFGMHGTFLFYAILSCVCVVLIYIFLPETKDKSLAEIEDYFKGNSYRYKM